MKRTIVLLLIALFAVMALSAASKNTGMALSKCDNSAVTSFVNYLIDKGMMDKYFPEYGIYQNSRGIYYLQLKYSGSGYSDPIEFYFGDDIILFIWYSGIILDNYRGKYDETITIFDFAMAAVCDYAAQYNDWASFNTDYDDNYNEVLYAESAMALDGLSSQGIPEAIWGRLRRFIPFCTDGFDYVKEKLTEHYEKYK